MPARFKMAAVIALTAMLGACTSLQPVSDWQTLHEGDKVRVTTAPDGAQISMKVLAVTPEGLQGQTRANPEPTVIAAEQITEVEQRHVSVLKTTGLVAGTVVVAFALLVTIAVATW
jgi:hypothetical protein